MVSQSTVFAVCEKTAAWDLFPQQQQQQLHHHLLPIPSRKKEGTQLRTIKVRRKKLVPIGRGKEKKRRAHAAMHALPLRACVRAVEQNVLCVACGSERERTVAVVALIPQVQFDNLSTNQERRLF